MSKYFILLLVFVALYIGGIRADNEEKALKIIKEYQDIPRYTYFTTGRKLTKYPEGFCGGTPAGECDWPKYAEAIVLLSGVTLIIGLVTLVFGVVFWVFRGFIFGGCRPTHGWMCPGPKYDPEIGEGYTNTHVWILKFVVIAVTLACVPIFIVSITGNSKTTSNVTDLGDVIIDKADNILDQIANFSTALSDPSFQKLQDVTDQIQTQLTSIHDDGVVVRDHAEDVSDYIDKFNNARNDIVLAGFIVGLVTVGVICVSALLNIPKLSCFGALALIILIPFTWIVFSAHYPINSFLSDVCVTYNQTGVDSLGNTSNALVQEVIKGCTENDTGVIPVFDNLVSLVNNLSTNGYEAICNVFENFCQVEYPYYVNEDYTLPPVQRKVMDCPVGTCGKSNYATYLNSTVHDFKYGCKFLNTTEYCNLDLPPTDCDVSSGDKIITCNYFDEPVSVCATNCTNSVLRGTSLNATEFVQTTEALNNLWVNNIMPVIGCSNLIPFINEVEDIVCIEEVNALTLLVAPSGIFAILLTIMGVLAVLGHKRFNNDARVKKNISREMH